MEERSHLRFCARFDSTAGKADELLRTGARGYRYWLDTEAG